MLLCVRLSQGGQKFLAPPGAEMQIHIVTFLGTQAIPGLRSIIMAGIQNGLVRQLRERLQTRIHVFRTAARQVNPAARVDKERVTGHQAILNQKTL